MKTTATTKPKVPAPTLVGAGATADLSSDVPERYIPSGVNALDNIILGAIAGEMLMIAGYTSQGKTSLAVQWAVGAAQNVGPSAVLSMEMSRRALRNRLVSTITGIDSKILRTREWESKKQKALAVQAGEYLAELPLYVDDRSGMTPEKVYDTLVSWPKHGIVLGVVDYLQLISSSNDSRAVQVSEAVKAVKEAAKDGDYPIIALSSINRAATAREDKKPKLSDLKESGDLEFTADTILMFHYPDDDYFEEVRAADIHVMKQRNGPVGVASAKFVKAATRFEDVQ